MEDFDEGKDENSRKLSPIDIFTEMGNLLASSSMNNDSLVREVQVRIYKKTFCSPTRETAFHSYS